MDSARGAERIEVAERLSVGEAAVVLGVKPRTVLAWIHAGRLEALRPGGSWQIPRAEVERLLQPSTQRRARRSANVCTEAA